MQCQRSNPGLVHARPVFQYFQLLTQPLPPVLFIQYCPLGVLISDKTVWCSVQNFGQEAGTRNFLSWSWPAMCRAEGPHSSSLFAGNDNIPNSIVTLCSFPPRGLYKKLLHKKKKSFIQVLELYWRQLCINMRYLLLLFVVQGICGKTWGASDAHFSKQKIAAGKTGRCAEHNVLIEQTALSCSGSHEHKTPGAQVSCPFTYFERKSPLPWPVKQWSSWTSVHRPCNHYLSLCL